MQVIPSIDLQRDRSRLVWWPGASAGAGAPTDRPDRVAKAFVELGASAIHLVDMDGPGQGRPVNLSAIAAVSREVAVPLQLAGGIDGPEQIDLAFAAGATRVVMPMWVAAERPELLAACVRRAGDWLAVGLDARPDRIADYPWRRPAPPTIERLMRELVDAGVGRFVLGHVGGEVARVRALVAATDAEVLVAGGITSVDALPPLRDAGVRGVLLGEVLFTGAVDLASAIRAGA